MAGGVNNGNMTDDLPDYIRGVAVNVHVSVEVPELVFEVTAIVDDIYPDVSEAAQAQLDLLKEILDALEKSSGDDLSVYLADALAKLEEIYDLVSEEIGLRLDEMIAYLSELAAATNPELATPTHFYPGKTKSYEDTSFVTAESPKTLAVAADLKRNGHDGYLTNDGNGNLKVEIEDPDEGWGGQHVIKKDEVLDLAMLNIKNIKLTWVANCGYRALVV